MWKWDPYIMNKFPHWNKVLSTGPHFNTWPCYLHLKHLVFWCYSTCIFTKAVWALWHPETHPVLLLYGQARYRNLPVTPLHLFLSPPVYFDKTPLACNNWIPGIFISLRSLFLLRKPWHLSCIHLLLRAKQAHFLSVTIFFLFQLLFHIKLYVSYKNREMQKWY